MSHVEIFFMVAAHFRSHTRDSSQGAGSHTLAGGPCVAQLCIKILLHFKELQVV